MFIMVIEKETEVSNEIKREDNEWWLKCSDLHIGNKIKLEDEGIAIPSYRYSYTKKIKGLKLFTHPDHPEYCLVYSTNFPIFNIWKYNIKQEAVAGTIYSKFLRFPKIDVFHINKILDRPYSPVNIECKKGQFIIYWHSDIHDDHSIFEISENRIVYEKLPIHRNNEYIIESTSDSDESDSDDPGDKDLKMLYSPCNNYYIKYAKGFEFVDVFNSQNDFLFRLTHNVYKSYYCCTIIEFVYNRDNELRILINDQHSCLGIYNMNGDLCFDNCLGDEFYTHMFRVTENKKEYLVLYGFKWGPINFISIYDLEKLVSDEDYEPEQYWEIDTKDLELNLNDCKDNNVCYGMTPDNFMKFMGDKKAKEENIQRELLNKRWLEENILKLILDEKTLVSFGNHIDQKLKENIDQILSYDKCPNITCFGGNSGSEFSYHADDIITKEVNHKKPDKIVIDLMARLVFKDDYDKWSKNGTDLKEVNFIFTIDKSIKMQVIIPMIKLQDKSTNWFPEHDENVKINITKK